MKKHYCSQCMYAPFGRIGSVPGVVKPYALRALELLANALEDENMA